MEEEDYATTFRLEDTNWWFVGMRQVCLELLPPSGPTTRVLDVGCGTGSWLDALDGRGGTVLGSDLSGTALSFARSRGSRPLLQAAGEALPVASGSIDVVTGLGVLEHIARDYDALVEWERVLRPGGRLVLLTSAYEWLWSGHDTSNHHLRRYTVGQAERLLVTAGFEPVSVSYVNTVLFPGIAAVRLAQRLARRGRPAAPEKDTAEVPPWANAALGRLLAAEGRRIAGGRRLPFGVSIVAAAEKPSSGAPRRPVR